jgi:hypothetical protein
VNRYLLCIDNEDGELDLTVHKLYQVGEPLPGDELAKEDGFVRVIDDSGEDYLYSLEFFVPVELSEAAAAAFLQAAPVP